MFHEEYYRLKTLVEENLMGYLPTEREESKRLLEAMKYSLDAGGKRVRPVLLLAACKMARGTEQEAMAFACAMECIHTYSLIHDDLPAMDDDDLRRGKPTNHIVFGEACAILAGDGLLNRAYEIMFHGILTAPSEKRAKMLQAAACIADAAGHNGMIGGQIADIESEKQGDCGTDPGKREKTLGFIHKNKTGALLQAAVLAGAYLGGAGETLLKDMGEFGALLGLEFQIADDILDVTGDEKTLGKPVGSDEKNGKLTYPACVGMEKTLQIYEGIHAEALKRLEKYGSDAQFFLDFAEDLYYRIK